MKTTKKLEAYYLKYSNYILWKKKPLNVIKIDYKENRHEWFSDGILSSYENLITRNLEKKFNNKNAIITVSKNKIIKSFTYDEIDKRVNQLIYYFLNLKKKILEL